MDAFVASGGASTVVSKCDLPKSASSSHLLSPGDRYRGVYQSVLESVVQPQEHYDEVVVIARELARSSDLGPQPLRHPRDVAGLFEQAAVAQARKRRGRVAVDSA